MEQGELQSDHAGRGAVVCYRLPHETYGQELSQSSDVRTFSSAEQLPLSGGYVIAPFQVSSDCPILLIQPDHIRQLQLQADDSWPRTLTCTDDSVEQALYRLAFDSAHARLMRGELEKIVMSRRLRVRFAPTASGPSASAHHTLLSWGRSLFLKACAAYPECFIAFWWTPISGAWIMATPEPILQKRNGTWSTVALAGTRPFGQSAVWSDKNKKEQAIVAQFITEKLQNVATNVETSDTYAFRTGRIEHLRTDFRFHLSDEASALQLLRHLHPTPAVCGMPRDAALQAILHDEHSSRRYYAGFSGPLNCQGRTNLFVSLRCAELSSDQATLYAGGGIMPESAEADEWDETRRKLTTMLSLF